jgi:hypothetical protein
MKSENKKLAGAGIFIAVAALGYVLYKKWKAKQPASRQARAETPGARKQADIPVNVGTDEETFWETNGGRRYADDGFRFFEAPASTNRFDGFE